MSRKRLDLPKPRGAAVMVGPDGKLPPADMSLVPPTTGDSIRAAFRADHVTLADMEEHLRRIEAMAPGAVITLTDAIRSLIQRGARAFREDERNQNTEDK